MFSPIISAYDLGPLFFSFFVCVKFYTEFVISVTILIAQSVSIFLESDRCLMNKGIVFNHATYLL